MPAQLIKLFIQATSSVVGSVDVTTDTTDTTVTPDVTRYYATVIAGNLLTTDTSIPATQFVDDNGNAVTTFPTLDAESYYNVYINSVLQQDGLTTLSNSTLTVNGALLTVGVPVVVEFADFSSTTSTSTADLANLQVDTTIET